MHPPQKQRSFPRPLIAGGCALLVLFACGLVLAGAGGILRLAQLTGREGAVRQPVATTLVEEQVGNSQQMEATGSTAVLENLRGWVEVQGQDGGWSPAAEGQPIQAGGRLRTGALSSVTLRFADGSQAALYAGGELSVDELDVRPEEERRIIVLTQLAGESDHSVTPLAWDDSRYAVSSPSGTGEAKGTLFHVAVSPEGMTRYGVTDGAITVTALNVTVLVGSGEYTTVARDEPPMEPVLLVVVQGLVSQAGDTWTVAGQTFTIDAATVLSGELQPGDWAWIEARQPDTGPLVAVRIVALHPSPANTFRLTGVVEAIGEGEWTVSGLAVVLADTTQVEAGILVGDRVQVEGQALAGGSLQATRIQRLAASSGLPFEFTGVVQSMSAQSWVVSGIQVNVDEATAPPEFVKAGMLVRVQGRIREDGVWLAEQIVLATVETSRFEFAGPLESIDPWKVAGVLFETREWTVIEAGLKTGDRVRVEGEVDAKGDWVAEEIERIEDESRPTMIFVGVVHSTNPWVISGIPVAVVEGTVVEAGVTVGMLVRVEVVLLEDGTWQVVAIEGQETLSGFPGCTEVIATVSSVEGSQVQISNWPVLTLDEGARIEGQLLTNSVIRFTACVGEALEIHITDIVVIAQLDEEAGIWQDEGGKAMVCHKPGKKKGGHTLSIGAPAVPAHLGHGDYLGPCR